MPLRVSALVEKDYLKFKSDYPDMILMHCELVLASEGRFSWKKKCPTYVSTRLLLCPITLLWIESSVVRFLLTWVSIYCVVNVILCKPPVNALWEKSCRKIKGNILNRFVCIMRLFTTRGCCCMEGKLICQNCVSTWLLMYSITLLWIRNSVVRFLLTSWSLYGEEVVILFKLHVSTKADRIIRKIKPDIS